MPTTLAQLAELVEGRLVAVAEGDKNLLITGAATLAVVCPGEITLADSEEYATRLVDSSAVAAIVSAEVPSPHKPTIVVEDVHAAFAQVVSHFRPQRSRQPVGISPAANVSPTAQMAEGVDIHPGAFIGDDVVVGPGSIIHSGARVMAGCQLGANVTLFPNAVLYEETLVGDRAIIHAGAILGAYGFGYKEQDGQHKLSAQLGYVQLGDDVEIGACVTVDRGTYGPTIIGTGTKVDNLVQIAHNCRIGQHNLICSQVGIAGSTSTDDYVVMAGQAGLRDHIHIGERSVICSKAGVTNNVEAGQVVLGQPATPIRRQKVQVAAISKLPEMRKEFRAMQRQIAAMQEQIDSCTKEVEVEEDDKVEEKSSEQAA